MLQIQNSTSSFHNSGNQLTMNDITSSHNTIVRLGEHKSQTDFSQTMANYQPSISDQVKVGFFSCDRYAQTEETDILNLSDAISNLIYLNKEMDDVKYDLKFTKNSTNSRFDTELVNKSIEIYAFINKKIWDLKNDQEENLKRIRRAYNTKLANAVIKISASFEEEYAQKKAHSAENRVNLTQTYVLKIKDLERQVAELEWGVSEARRLADENLALVDEKHREEVANLEEEKRLAHEQEAVLVKKIEKLEENMALKDEETEHLHTDITSLETEVQTHKETNQELTKQFEEFKRTSESEKKKIKLEFEKQRVALETKMHEKLKESREQIVNAAKQELASQKANQEQDRQRLLDEQKALLAEQDKEKQRLLAEQEAKQKSDLDRQEQLLAKQQKEKEEDMARLNKEKTEQEEALRKSLKDNEKAMAEAANQERERDMLMKSAKNSRPEDIDMILKLRTSEQYLKSDIARLNREIARTNETWEKKFDILKHSLHAIKDEMYLRQNLQKSSVNLAYASIAYTMDQPPSFREKNNRNDGAGSQKTVLPSIGANRTGDRPLSVTISMPSRLSAQFEKDENQVIGDDEMKQFKDEFMNGVDYIPARQET